MMILTSLLSFLLFQVSVIGAYAYTPDQQQQPPINSNAQNQLEDYSVWTLNFSSEAPHYFASVHSLLQQWPNTIFPNGHAIVPGEIQPYTKLYHGRLGDELPPSPEWLVFDVEMAYRIMGSTSNAYMFTYQTTRSVQVLYFDGESAALQGTGQLDTQMLHIFGNVTGPIDNNRTSELFDEYARVVGLCNWLSEKKLGGVGWGFEGIVRMNAGFELIWCNFSSPSLRLISYLNVTAPSLPPSASKDDLHDAWLNPHGHRTARAQTSPFPLPPSPTRSDKATDPTKPMMLLRWRHTTDNEPFLKAQGWGWFKSAAKHYGSSGLGSPLGESRVKLSFCSILNYYSPEFQSQALARAMYEQEKLNLTSEGLWLGPKEEGSGNRIEALNKLTRRRRKHRLDKIDSNDAVLMRDNAERAMLDIVKGNRRRCSGADWYMITNEIVKAYAVDLMRLQLVLNSSVKLPPTNYLAVRDWMVLVRAQNRAFLIPFLQYPLDLKDQTPWVPGSNLAKETFARCKYHHTILLAPGEGTPLSPEEELLRWAVEETMGAICSATQAIGFAVEKTWLAEFSERKSSPSTDWRWEEKMQLNARRWNAGIEELMAWLGWAGEWVRCEKTCAWDEECCIPMWPLKGPMGQPPKGNSPRGGFPPGDGRPPSDGPAPGMEDDIDLWQSKCIKAEHMV